MPNRIKGCSRPPNPQSAKGAIEGASQSFLPCVLLVLSAGGLAFCSPWLRKPLRFQERQDSTHPRCRQQPEIGLLQTFCKGSPKCGPGKYIGMKPMASAKKSSRSNGSSRTKASFVLCVRNTGYPASLETRKLYSTVPDAPAARHNLIRVIDESGEDYLYPADYFVALRLPANVKSALLQAS